METLIENNTEKIVEHSVSKLQEETVWTFKQIWGFAKHNNYVYNKHPKYNEDDLNAAIGKLTLNQRRKLKRTINIFRLKQTIGAANRFYHFVYSKVLKIDLRIKLTYPEKYLEIIKKRGRYLLLRAQMEKALQEYKNEKGDYFKLRLEEGKKLQ
jgi:hypothetical protein